jgi:hypothetical protein
MNVKILNHVSLDGNVIVKKGSGGATGGGGGNYVYFDTRSITEFGDETSALYGYAYLIKERFVNGDIIVTTTNWGYNYNPPLAVCIDMNLKINAWDESDEIPLPEMITLGEDIAKYHPWILDLPRLTEKEFYKVAPDPGADPTLIVTRYNGEIVPINYEEGMTWYEWCNSELNNTKFICYQNDDKGTIHFGDSSPEMIINADFAGNYPSYEDTIKTIDVISKDINYTTVWLD